MNILFLVFAKFTHNSRQLLLRRVRVGDTTKVPDLGINEAAIGVDGIRDLLPASDLLGIPEARSGLPLSTKQGRPISWMSLCILNRNVPLTSDQDAFGDDEASSSSGALSVVLGHEVGRDSLNRPVPGHGGNLGPVGDSDVAHLERGEEGFSRCDGRHNASRWLVCGLDG